MPMGGGRPSGVDAATPYLEDMTSLQRGGGSGAGSHVVHTVAVRRLTTRAGGDGAAEGRI